MSHVVSPCAQTFFGTTFLPSLVTAQNCDGRDLGSPLLKMAAGLPLNGAVKYVYPDRHFVGGKRTNKLHSGKKGDKARVPKQQMLQLFQKLEGDVAILTEKWSQNMLTKQARDLVHLKIMTPSWSIQIKSICPTDVIKAYNKFTYKANEKAVIPGKVLCDSMGI